MKKMYLGDGAYVEDRGHDLELYTTGASNEKENCVYLGYGEVENLLKFVELARNVKITVTRKPKFSHGTVDPIGAHAPTSPDSTW